MKTEVPPPQAGPHRDPRPRPRRGSLERPVSTRIYRAAWALVAAAVLVAAFTVGRPDPLPAPELPPSFDQETARALARELADQFPDRSPGAEGSRGAADWVAERLGEFGLTTDRVEFSADAAGLGHRSFVNVLGVLPADSRRAIVVMAHRDNLGLSPGANDNASGTAALLELARNVVTPAAGEQSALTHSLVFVSTDGGAFGNLGALEVAAHPQEVLRLVGADASLAAVVNLDALGGPGTPRLELAGDTPRSPAVSLVATADASILAQSGSRPSMPNPAEQLLDLGFPFNFFGQAPLVAHGIPAVTLTTGGGRPASPYHDTVAALREDRLGALGRSAEALLGSLDQAADADSGATSYVYLRARFLRGWAIELVLLATVFPFLAATIDLFARCRRRRIRLLPALLSLRSRLGVWLWAGGLFALLAVAGAFPDGASRPLAPDSRAAGDWPEIALLALLGFSAAGWLVARSRLVPRRAIVRSDELAGHLAAMLALLAVAGVVAASNPFALVFLLPSLHAWLWLPHVDEAGRHAKVGLFAAGLAGPLLLVLSFALRFELGLDTPWYLAALAAGGYVPLPLLFAFLVWGAAASQVGALAAGRYSPYPARSDRPRRGPIRELIRRLVLRTGPPRRPRSRAGP